MEKNQTKLQELHSIDETPVQLQLVFSKHVHSDEGWVKTNTLHKTSQYVGPAGLTE